MTTAAAFDLDRVSVAYPSVRALDGVTLRVAPGEAVAFVGPSGSGKTTLLRVLNGSVRPSSGVVRVAGDPLSDLAPAALRHVRAAIGFVHQDLRLVPTLRVIQNVVAGRLGAMGVAASMRALFAPPRAVVHEVHAVLERVGIPEKLYERTDRLSGGQQQRVAIARALFQRPRALLADEPVSSVDPARARDAVRLLTDLSRERSITLGVSLHNLDLAREFFPRLVGLRHGRVVFDCAPGDVRSDQFDDLYDLDPTGRPDDGR
jgi:phosphonate transport system ATP-binding protein